MGPPGVAVVCVRASARPFLCVYSGEVVGGGWGKGGWGCIGHCFMYTMSLIYETPASVFCK